MEIPPANITQTESPGAENRTASAEGITLEMGLGAKKLLLPDKLGEELWREAGAELVEVSRAEFAEALETIGVRDNYGLDPERQANEAQRETFWQGLHLEDCPRGSKIALCTIFINHDNRK